ncbi:MAG: L,D-transpeptidase [Bacteroidetes bacterium]|nr:L,D-transpeptidase [Bacteroidota bacterium]
MKYINHKLFFIIIICLLCCCNPNNSEAESNEIENNSIEEDAIVEEVFSLDYPEIKYNLVHITSTKHLNEIKDKYKNDTILGTAYRKAIRTLNRKEIRFFRVGQSVIIPDSIIPDMCAYSIFPDEYKAAKDIEKIIMIDIEYQCYGCYEYGKLVRFAATNTGSKSSQTEPGKYYFTWKKKEHKSSYDSTWIMPFTFNMHKFGTAMHQFVMPGRPVSHSCLRQFIDDAEWIYHWGDVSKRDSENKIIPNSGTPVIVLNRFDYSRKSGGPWLDLTSNKSYYSHLPDNPLETPDAVITRKQPPMQKRN